MRSTPRPPAPGLPAVGGYQLLTKIGEGGMGVVHLARRPGGDRVALKVIRPHIVGDDEARARLAREVGSLRRIRSPRVAEIIDADPWGQIPYVATRYVPGLSLHDHVREEGPIARPDLVRFARCLVEALAAVHAAGVLHRDVKPSNVLMEGRSPVLIDFGLARVAEDPRLTHTGWLLGTPGYLAPEILHGQDATPASDVHSLAATLAFAGTGRAPFGGGPAMAIMDRVRRGEHDLTGLPEPLRGLVTGALAPDPRDRPSLAELGGGLDRLAGSAAPAVASPAPAPPTMPLAVARLAESPTTEVRPSSAGRDQAGAPGVPAPGSAVDARPGPGEARWPLKHPLFLERVLPRAAGPAASASVVAGAASAAPAPGLPASGLPASGLSASGMPAPGMPAFGQSASGTPPGLLPAGPGPAPGPATTRQLPEEPHTTVLGGRPPAAAGSGGVDRLRRGSLLAVSALASAAAVAAYPYLAILGLVLAVWVVRATSLTGSALAERRWRRGRKWHDGLGALLSIPWHLLGSVPGTLLLAGWALGMALAAVLLCYAAGVGLVATLTVAGLAFAGSVWWGPGGSRVRGPVDRAVRPLSRSAWGWFLATVLVLVVGSVPVQAVSVRGPDWAPFSQGPIASLPDLPRWLR